MEVSNKQALVDGSENPIADFFTMGQSTNVLTDGPLAHACSDILDQMYRREYDPITGVAMETQQLDQVAASRAWLAAKDRCYNFVNGGNDIGMVYGVKETQATRENLIDVSDTLAQMNDSQRSNSAIIVIKDNGGLKPVVSVLALAIEEYARAHGVRVYLSMKEFVQKHAA